MTELERSAARGSPETMAVDFLKAMEVRDLVEARTYLADEVVMRFPGATFTSLEAMVEGAGHRYRWVKKRVEATESLSADGSSTVFVRGTLYGENLFGVPFEGVRFIDRFEFRGGKIVVQDVWNDLAESGVLVRRG